MGRRHIRRTAMICPYCHQEFRQYYSFRRHLSDTHLCYSCGIAVRSKFHHTCLRRRQTGGGRAGDLPFSTAPFVETQTSLLGVFKRFELELTELRVLVGKWYREIYSELNKFIIKLVDYYHGVKLRFVLEVYLLNQSTNHADDQFLTSETYLFLNEHDIKPNIVQMVTEQIENLNLFTERGSNWSIIKIKTLNIYTSHPRLIKAGAGLATPSCYKQRKGLINIRCPENKCFQFSCLSKFMKHKTKKEGEPVQQYKLYEKYNDENQYINFSSVQDDEGVSIGHLRRFEQLNPNISVNVYHHDNEKKKIYPIRLTRQMKKLHIDLMRVRKKEKAHFILISNFSAFMG